MNGFFRRKPRTSQPSGHRRVVTGHDTAGRAVFERDERIGGYLTSTQDAILTSLWATNSFPCDNTDPRDGRQLIAGLAVDGGSVVRIVDMLPRSRSPFHRTRSLDYGIVVSGEVWLELDDGVETRLFPGDVVVQRGTIHAWVNKADVPASIVFILLDALPVKAAGQALDATDMPGVT